MKPHNQRAGKQTIPVTITLDDTQRILDQWSECGWENGHPENDRFITNDGAERIAGAGTSFLAVWYIQTTNDTYRGYTEYRV